VVLSTPTPACATVKPFKFVSANAQGSLRVTRELGVTAKPGYAWPAVGAGQLSGKAVFAAARSSADDTALEAFAFSASDASAPTQLSSAALTASVPLPVIGVSVADIYADAPPTYSSRMPTRRQTCFGSPRALRPSTALPQPASTPSRCRPHCTMALHRGGLVAQLVERQRPWRATAAWTTRSGNDRPGGLPPQLPRQHAALRTAGALAAPA
jgi:hypothetical protein